MGKKFISIILVLGLVFALVVPVSAAATCILDEAELLTDQERGDLEETAQQIQENYGLDLLILTVNSLEEQSARRYAEDYCDSYSYSDNSLLLLISMEERDWYILVNGDACDVFGDQAQERLENALLDDLGSGDYYDAFSAYLYTAESCLANSEAEEYPSDTTRLEDDDDGSDVSIIWSIVVGVAAASVSLIVMRSGMNTTKRQSGAAEYIKSGSYHLRENRDMFLYSQVKKTKKSQNNNSSGSRSGRSRSSSSRSSSRRSGRGGKF